MSFTHNQAQAGGKLPWGMQPLRIYHTQVYDRRNRGFVEARPVSSKPVTGDYRSCGT